MSPWRVLSFKGDRQYGKAELIYLFIVCPHSDDLNSPDVIENLVGETRRG